MKTMETNNTDKMQESQNPTTTVRTMIPLVDIYEIPDAYMVKANLPGVDRQSISASINNSTLTVHAKAPAHFKQDASLMYDDSIATEYRREFSLADDVDTGSIDAVYELGVLSITLKKKTQYTPKEITIR